MTDRGVDGRRFEGGSFTDRVRQEIARVEPSQACDQLAELAALIRLGGNLHLRGGGDGDRLVIEVETLSGAVARRTYALLQDHDVTTELRVRQPGGVRTRSTYVVAVTRGADLVARAIGLLDAAGRPAAGLDESLVAKACDRVAYARGAVLAGASINNPTRAPHLEIPVSDNAFAHRLAGLLGEVSGGGVSVAKGRRGHRVVVKSAEAIGEILAQVGARDAYLQWEEHRIRRHLRGEATRLANADAANLRRAVDAASQQIAAVETAIERIGWDALGEGLRQVALARLANPSASLTEVGELCDPVIGKSAVLRRLRRLDQLAEEAERSAEGRPG